MGTCAIKGTRENKGFGQRKTLFAKNYLQKKIPDKVLRSRVVWGFLPPLARCSLSVIIPKIYGIVPYCNPKGERLCPRYV
jgi:hypothetical protein